MRASLCTELQFDFLSRYQMQDYTAAVDVFERLLEFQPNDVGHYTNLGRLCEGALLVASFSCQFSCSSLVMLDDFVEAERVYMHVVQHKPFDPSSYLNLGLCR